MPLNIKVTTIEDLIQFVKDECVAHNDFLIALQLFRDGSASLVDSYDQVIHTYPNFNDLLDVVEGSQENESY